MHRDITSGNILLKGDGHACLADFGLAHQLATAESIVVGSALQADSILIGTFGYMAPEYGAKSGALAACMLLVPARLCSFLDLQLPSIICLPVYRCMCCNCFDASADTLAPPAVRATPSSDTYHSC